MRIDLNDYDFHTNWTPETSDKRHLEEAIRQTLEYIKYFPDRPEIIKTELDRIEYLRSLLKKFNT